VRGEGARGRGGRGAGGTKGRGGRGGRGGWGGEGAGGRGGLVFVTTAAACVRGLKFDVQRCRVLWVKNAEVQGQRQSRSREVLSALPTWRAVRGRGPTPAHHCEPCVCCVPTAMG
jgi:hypothetical protein